MFTRWTRRESMFASVGDCESNIKAARAQER